MFFLNIKYKLFYLDKFTAFIHWLVSLRTILINYHQITQRCFSKSQIHFLHFHKINEANGSWDWNQDVGFKAKLLKSPNRTNTEGVTPLLLVLIAIVEELAPGVEVAVALRRTPVVGRTNKTANR